MSYNKYTWQTGETITADKLNHIEDGIVGASSSGFFPLVVNAVAIGDESYRLDKTWQEICDAFPNVYIYQEHEEAAGRYSVFDITDAPMLKNVITSEYVYTTTSADGYPSYGESPFHPH